MRKTKHKQSFENAMKTLADFEEIMRKIAKFPVKPDAQRPPPPKWERG